MAFDCGQIRRVIQDTLLPYPELGGDSAVNLLLGTLGQESDFGTFLSQWPQGPALGVMQMEPKTFQYIVQRFGGRYPVLLGRTASDLITDLELAFLSARLRYRDVPDPLPAADDIPGMASYWDRFYNRNSIDETKQFIAKYRQYVKED